MNFIRKELQTLQIARNTDMITGRLITPITRAFERYSPALVLTCIWFWILPITKSVDVSGFDLIEYSHNSLQHVISNDLNAIGNMKQDYLTMIPSVGIMSDNATQCISIDFDPGFTFWKFGYVINNLKKHSSMAIKVILMYHQQHHMMAINILLSSSMISNPVLAGPATCAGCISLAAGTCCAACALANAYCFAFGPFAAACLVTVCGGGCVVSFTVCIPICIALPI
eukprot:287304_1